MIKRKADYPVQQVENMRGGDGTITVENLLTPAELYEKGRLYARLTIEPGCSIGYHVHEGEMESYYILSGKAEVSDNGEMAVLGSGDSVWTPSGEGHSAKNIGDTPLEMIALILFK